MALPSLFILSYNIFIVQIIISSTTVQKSIQFQLQDQVVIPVDSLNLKVNQVISLSMFDQQFDYLCRSVILSATGLKTRYSVLAKSLVLALGNNSSGILEPYILRFFRYQGQVTDLISHVWHASDSCTKAERVGDPISFYYVDSTHFSQPQLSTPT